MGQRLNIEIEDNGQVVANAYLHWSAYTSSSIVIAKNILKLIPSVQNIADKKIQAIKLLEGIGSGLTVEELNEANKLYPSYEFKPAENRNNGLTTITHEGMNDTRKWEEGRISIDINNQTVMFSVLNSMSESEYKNDYEGEPKDTITGNFDIDEMTYADLEALELIGEEQSYFKLKDYDNQIFYFDE